MYKAINGFSPRMQSDTHIPLRSALILFMALLLAFSAAVPVGAQEEDLPPAGTVPGSPFFFAERFFEGIGTFFAFGNSAKARRYLALAEERLAEAKVLAEEGDEDAQAAVALYEEQAAKAKERAARTGEIDIEGQVTDATTKHLTALDDVFEKVPEQAKASIQAARERSMAGQIEALRGIAERDPERAVDIFARAAEGRLRAAEARAGRGGDDVEEVEEVEDALNEFSEYAEFGAEISTLAGGLQTGETTVEELVKRATSHHSDILRSVQEEVPAEAQESIERAMESASKIQELLPAIPAGGQGRDGRGGGDEEGEEEGQQGEANGSTGASNAPVDTNRFAPSDTGQRGPAAGAEEEENEKFLEDYLPKIGILQPIETASTTTSNISSWSTYINKKYSYQIKYPTDWAVEVDGVAVWQNQVPNPELGSGIMFFGTKTEPYGQTARALWNIRVFVSPVENTKKLSPRDWFIEQSKRHFSYGVEQKFDNLENTTFKGLPALKVNGNPGEGYSFLVAKGSTIYNLAFSFEKFSGGEFPAPPEEIFLEMLDSFILN